MGASNIANKTGTTWQRVLPAAWPLAAILAFAGMSTGAEAAIQCGQTITANVVVFDNPTVFNRLGAQNPNWITYALERDVVDRDSLVPCSMTACTAGNVELRPDKRPRPLVIRSVEGACLDITFTNLLAGPANAGTNPFQDPGGANPNNAQQDNLFNNDQVKGRCAGFHATGAELRNEPNESGFATGNDGSMVGANPGAELDPLLCGDGLVPPGDTITYKLYTPREGAYVINSYGATLGSEANSGNLGIGMFGALNVQPPGARMYRSQVTEEELRLATARDDDGNLMTVPSDCGAGDVVGVHCNPGGQPIIDYEATYPEVQPWIAEGKANLPVLNMLTAGGELVHADINAIIVGPNGDGSFPPSTYPLEAQGRNNPQLPNRLEAFREFTSVFHDEQTNSQVFPRWYNDPVLGFTLAGVKDAFMINYGSGGIGSEIIANRLHTGPMHDCTNCAYEEFFLSSSTVGDPALLVQFPANTGIEQCDPTAIAGPTCWRDPDKLANGPVRMPDGQGGFIENFALFQEDPSNVHHAYTGDHTKIRNTHAGAFEQHIFHLHNHQWLFNPNDDNANYLDAQEIMPGSGHTYELVNGGVGNRNKTTGDAIFHCHFYPHFAQGMWYHIRIMDVMETGSLLAVSTGAGDNLGFNDGDGDGFHDARFALRSGQPAAGTRALPDGELPDGVPIPAIVPIPGKPMPQMPAKVQVAAVDRGSHSLLGGRGGPDGIPDSSQAFVDRTSVAGADGKLGTADDVSPGYPFWLAGNECGPWNMPDEVEPGFEADPDTLADPATGTCPRGIVGQRMPTPPLDMLTNDESTRTGDSGAVDAGYLDAQAGGHDGGLPRHSLLGYVSGGLSLDHQNRLDFRKVVELAQPVFYEEVGTDLERVSMAYQAERTRPSATNQLVGKGYTTDVDFVLNGAPPVPGGPYNNPCVDDRGAVLVGGVTGHWLDGDGVGTPTDVQGKSEFHSDNPRTYKLANIQIDAVFNKVGYHYPQERIISLWEDVDPYITKDKPPEPLVMRFNTFDCGKLLHTNLVPHEYELDDFQVRTPTDIIGQHIHLPKWDLTTNDGAANGWNYEDGALAPGIVRERIKALNEFNHLVHLAHKCETVNSDAECGIFVDPVTGTFTQGVLPAGSLPGQLGPIDLNDFEEWQTIATGDTGGTIAGLKKLDAAEHPFFGPGVNGEYLGARTVIQRMLIDPVLNIAGVDRGLGLTFSHDHYGPSTFQQIGLYSSILAEPAGSTWKHNETGEPMYTRHDGGPTSWQAIIEPPTSGGLAGSDTVPAHREFYFEMSDFQHAYEAGVYVGAGPDGRPGGDGVIMGNIVQPDPFNATVATATNLQNTWKQAVNPPLKLRSQFPDVVTAHDTCPGPAGNNDPGVPRPCVEAINISHASMWVTNYRNEPVGLRVFDPNKPGPDGNNGAQADGPAGDLAFAFASRTDRAIPELNTSSGKSPYKTPAYCTEYGDGINCDRRPGDPFTPIMRAYERDEIKVKIQVGATEEQHQVTVHGMKWLSNGSGFGRSPNSGWRNFQSHGISEQFTLSVPMHPDLRQPGNRVDYLYASDATRDGIWSGTWGVLRTYGNRQNDLVELPGNAVPGRVQIVNQQNFNGVCPTDAPVRSYDVTAVLANDVLPKPLGVTIPANLGGDSDDILGGDNAGGELNPDGGTLVYNRRTTAGPVGDGPLNDPTAMLYVRTDELVSVVDNARADTVNCYETVTTTVVVNKRGKTRTVTEEVFNPDLESCKAEYDLAACYAADGTLDGKLATCPVRLHPDAPVEPLVLRAEAGDCINVTLRNRLLNEPAKTTDGQPVYNLAGARVWTDKGGENELYVMDPTRTEGEPYCGGLPCLPVDVKDVIFDAPPDLAGWQDVFWVVNRDLGNGVGQDGQMHFFNNNLIRPSAYVGMHPQLVHYDIVRGDGIQVGGNPGGTIAQPGGDESVNYQWYAGDISYVPVQAGCRRNRSCFEIVATPIEFGGTNLLSADRVKQPQKGLFGALVIEPPGATWPDALAELDEVPDGQGTGAAKRRTRAQVTVQVAEDAGDPLAGGDYREGLLIGHRIANLRWKDGTAIANIHQGELGREGAEDSGHAGFNYGMEPSWFRFGLAPDADFGNAGTPDSFGSIPNVHALYSNDLVAGKDNAVPAIAGVSEAGDPATPVIRAPVGDPTDKRFDTRIHLLNGASADRDGTFVLHGHVWQRDPFVCRAESMDDNDESTKGGAGWLNVGDALWGRCDPQTLGSQALGWNPLAKWMGSQEGLGHVFGHWPILFDAGGTGQVPGDYLYRDYSPGGNRNGQFGILRVED